MAIRKPFYPKTIRGLARKHSRLFFHETHLYKATDILNQGILSYKFAEKLGIKLGESWYPHLTKKHAISFWDPKEKENINFHNSQSKNFPETPVSSNTDVSFIVSLSDSEIRDSAKTYGEINAHFRVRPQKIIDRKSVV